MVIKNQPSYSFSSIISPLSYCVKETLRLKKNDYRYSQLIERVKLMKSFISLHDYNLLEKNIMKNNGYDVQEKEMLIELLKENKFTVLKTSKTFDLDLLDIHNDLASIIENKDKLVTNEILKALSIVHFKLSQENAFIRPYISLNSLYINEKNDLFVVLHVVEHYKTGKDMVVYQSLPENITYIVDIDTFLKKTNGIHNFKKIDISILENYYKSLSLKEKYLQIEISEITKQKNDIESCFKDVQINTLYHYFKGVCCYTTCLAYDNFNKEKYVIYFNLTNKNKLIARPLHKFLEDVSTINKTINIKKQTKAFEQIK